MTTKIVLVNHVDVRTVRVEKNSRKMAENYLTLCAEYYDLQPHRDEEAALPFYMRYALNAHGPVLEPMCGTGRFLLPMLNAGIDIEGFDASAAMLKLLQNKYAAQYDGIAPVTQQFVQDFISNKKYALIFIPYGSWGLIVKQSDAQKALQKMYDHLADGGTFLFEVETVASAPQSLNAWHRSVRKRADGTYIALNTFPTYDPKTQLFNALCRYESLENRTVIACEEELFQMYLYTFDEMEMMLAAVGFKNITKYQDFNKTKATDKQAHLLIYECIK